MSYNIGANPTNAQKLQAAKDALTAEYERFASIATQGAKDIESTDRGVANALRNSVGSLRRGLQNVFDGKLALDVWEHSVTGLIEQVRQEAPFFSVSTLLTARDGVHDSAIYFAKTFREVVKETTGKDPGELLDTAASTVKWVAGAVVVGGLAYLVMSTGVIRPKPKREPA